MAAKMDKRDGASAPPPSGCGRTSAVQFWTFTMPKISGGMEFWALRPPAEPAEGRPCAVLNWIPRPLFGCRHARREPIRSPRLRADGQDEQMGARIFHGAIS